MFGLVLVCLFVRFVCMFCWVVFCGFVLVRVVAVFFAKLEEKCYCWALNLSIYSVGRVASTVHFILNFAEKQYSPESGRVRCEERVQLVPC